MRQLVVRCGKSVPVTSSADSARKVTVIESAMMFSQRGLTQGPSTARSLHSSSRNTVALGSSTPARAGRRW